MLHKGIEFDVLPKPIDGKWRWQFQIEDKVTSGYTKNKLHASAVMRAKKAIDRYLRSDKALGALEKSASSDSAPVSIFFNVGNQTQERMFHMDGRSMVRNAPMPELPSDWNGKSDNDGARRNPIGQ